MKKNVVKMAFAAVCVVAAGVSGFKAYDSHNKNVVAANMLLAENVEALSSGDGGFWQAVGGIVGGIISSSSSSKEEPKTYQYLTTGSCYMTVKINNKNTRVEGHMYVCGTCSSESSCHLPIPNPCV